MIRKIQRRLRYFNPLQTSKKRWVRQKIRLADCVSYHGFHYQNQSEHPLQKYALGLVQNLEIRFLRAQFIEFLQFYRPENAAQAMGLPGLDPSFPMWIYPWQPLHGSEFVARRAWRTSPAECPDILTHFCDDGIPSFRIEEEWLWTERALDSLRAYGYRPERFGFMRAQTLRAKNGELAHLLLDGNHRAAALCAQGVADVEVLIDERAQVNEAEVNNWPGVKNGYFEREAALQIFHGFFEGNCAPQTTTKAAKILAPEGWLALYL